MAKSVGWYNDTSINTSIYEASGETRIDKFLEVMDTLIQGMPEYTLSLKREGNEIQILREPKNRWSYGDWK